MILAGKLADAAEVARFHTEAEAAARLDHPNIVPIYEIGEHEGRHYFSMRLIDGGNLAEKLAGKPLVPSRAASLLAEIARAVHYAHQHGILHRDLKPTNILLGRNGEPYVTDFGLARLLDAESEITGSMAVMGSVNYMSPEQADGHTRDVTTATDIYSLGAILYEALTGIPPFQSGSLIDTLHRLAEEEAELPQNLNREVERDLATIC
jgi:serine/threonine-protein kinase